jgi:hypothetical protein
MERGTTNEYIKTILRQVEKKKPSPGKQCIRETVNKRKLTAY